MRSIVLSNAARTVTPLLMVFSVFMFVRGHNEPGGGFIGGLIAAAGLALCVLAEGPKKVQEIVRVPPRTLLAVGLLVAVFAGIVGVLQGDAVLKGVWINVPTPLGTAKVGTPLLFDLGVYLVVIGTVLTFIFTLSQEDQH